MQSTKDGSLHHISGYDYPSREAAVRKCAEFGGVLASTDQVSEAFKRGADWCSWGYTSDNVVLQPRVGCSHKSEVAILADKKWNNVTYGATCYGIRPVKGMPKILPFNETTWSGWEVPIITANTKEVYHINGTDYTTKAAASTKCTEFGAVLASIAQLQEAFTRGADWCSWGHIADNVALSNQNPTSCKESNSKSVAVLASNNWTGKRKGANCFGVRPVKGMINVLSFNGIKWSDLS